MKIFLAPIILMTLLFPALAYGVTMDDLVIRDGIYYKKFSTVPFTGTITESVEQGSFKDGKKHGPWVSYNKDGQLRFASTFKNGKQDGPWVGYWNNGQLSQKGTYKDDKKDGPWVGYHENGQLDYKGTFKDGKREGPWVSHHYYGQLMHKGTFKDGNQDGPWVGFNKDGTVNEEYTGTFKNDVKVK
jgi:antitoxin component YwqK of YwqJK toxin-antitoxin module